MPPQASIVIGHDKPICHFMRSEATQAGALFENRSRLLRSARNDEIT